MLFETITKKNHVVRREQVGRLTAELPIPPHGVRASSHQTIVETLLLAFLSKDWDCALPYIEKMHSTHIESDSGKWAHRGPFRSVSLQSSTLHNWLHLALQIAVFYTLDSGFHTDFTTKNSWDFCPRTAYLELEISSAVWWQTKALPLAINLTARS